MCDRINRPDTRLHPTETQKHRVNPCNAGAIHRGRSGALEYLGEIANDPGAISKLRDCLRVPASRWRFVMRPDRAVMAFIANLQTSAIGATWWRRR